MQGRILSVDLTRGFVVAISVILVHIPRGGPAFLRSHADWYGLTALDLVFPAFITVFGMSMALAHRHRVIWPKLFRRTLRLIVLGLLFNMAVTWNMDLGTLRFTGVLQFFAVIGLLVAVAASFSRKGGVVALTAVLLLFAYGALLLVTSRNCPGGIPQPDCNLSQVVDSALFGSHQYAQGARGHDPEGVVALMGATANALFGFAAGWFLLERLRENRSPFYLLTGMAALLLLATPVLSGMVPIAKRIWSPPFAALTSAVTILLLAWFQLILAHLSAKNPVTWFLQAFGRNSLLIYFGQFVLMALMANLSVAGIPLNRHLQSWFAVWSPYPVFTYTALMFALWAAVATLLHWRRWYIIV